jgi:hypothetical protein
MDDIPVFNGGSMPLWVGGQMVPPGETRLLPAHHVPAHLHPAVQAAPLPPAEAPADPLAEILDGSVKDVVAALPGLDADQLMELEGLEGLREAPRKGVLEAVAAALLQRAAQAPANPPTGAGDGD